MVGRGGGRKTSCQKIPPGRLQSCVQASRKLFYSKQNVNGIGNNMNLPITNEVALMVAKNLERQKNAYTANKTRQDASPTLMNDTHQPEVNHNSNDTNVENGETNSTQHDLFDETSQGLIPPLDEGLLGKRKRESNFVSRIEVGMQMNKASDPRPRENNIRSEVAQVNTEGIDANTATSKTKGRGKRGMYKSYVVDMKIKGKGSKLRVKIPDDIDRAIGENARHLVNECGRVVRTKAPFNVQKWNKAFEATGDSMLKEIEDKFEIAQSGDYLRLYAFVAKTMQRLYRLFKCRLHYYYKTCGNIDEERQKNPPPDLPQPQWEYLIKHYGSPHFKAASARNSKNRNSDKRVKHTTGNLSFPESEDILTKKNGNVKPSADVIWLFNIQE